ncbi:MAG: isoleucine--tRNA ligase, partial [Candidatus Micrarchaeota archaeon]|nr:isoleucine--tRNA ligase [Candidatus Micrarchaeota archaeon]
IEAIWRTIKAASDKQLLTEGVYVVPQCVRCETSLANYELEYDEQDDPSLYVKFKVKGTANEYLVIWTTTPWTLVANMAVMVHPTHAYVKVKVGDEIWVVAKERLDGVMAFRPLDSAVLVGELSGKKLEGVAYEHPLQSKINHTYERKVILSDEFVTMDDGSGLVHCAPGHGPEDFIVARRFNVPVFSPVDAAGHYTEAAGSYAGKGARDSNALIISDLEAAGALIHAGKIRHRYPHCWRCKTPLIFIATHQWFISVTKLKERMLEEVDKTINFQPDFAKTRFRDFVATAPDWCISRQRYWGAPLPIWICENKACGKRRVLFSRAELPDPAIELHRPYIDAVTFKCDCGSVQRRVPDILDVWFDSGNAVWAQLGPQEDWDGPSGTLVADFIVEGKDQTRGWFYSLLGSGIVLQNEAPYRNLLMHGFFVDEKGEKMSKSVGNFVPLEEILSKYGADTFRLWGLSSTVWDDLRFNWKELDENKRVLDILLNMGTWMERFYSPPVKPVEERQLEIEDKWLRSRTQTVIETVTKSFDSYQPHVGLVALKEFLVEDVSRFYLKRLKQRINEERNAAAGLSTLYDTLDASIRLLAPYTPFVSEHLYQSVFKKYMKAESVSLLPWPAVLSGVREPLLEQQMTHMRAILNASANARAKANLKLRWPAEEIRIKTESTEVAQTIERMSGLIESLGNVRKVRAGAPPVSVEVDIKSAKIGAAFKADSPAVMAALAKQKPADIAAGLAASKPNQPWMLEGKYPIDVSMAVVTETATGYALADFDDGKVFVKTVMNESLYQEAMEREIARRIQAMRKEMGLQHADIIEVWMAGDAELLKAAKKGHKAIAEAVNAKDVHVEGHAASGAHSKEWDIEDMKVKIAAKRLG